tara:strand:- start:43515 stop:43709 length:195 start_codon:yes stop_codon:yes gene_type:complete
LREKAGMGCNICEYTIFKNFHFVLLFSVLPDRSGTQAEDQMPKKNHHAKAMMVTDRFSYFTPAS